MSGITLSQAQIQLSNWLALLAQLSSSPHASGSMNGQAWAYKDIAQVQQQVDHWDAKVKELAALASGSGSAGSRSAIPNRYRHA